MKPFKLDETQEKMIRSNHVEMVEAFWTPGKAYKGNGVEIIPMGWHKLLRVETRVNAIACLKEEWIFLLSPRTPITWRSILAPHGWDFRIAPNGTKLTAFHVRGAKINFSTDLLIDLVTNNAQVYDYENPFFHNALDDPSRVVGKGLQSTKGGDSSA